MIYVKIKSLPHVDIIIDITSLSQSIFTLSNDCIANIYKSLVILIHTPVH